jgi:HSP20 family protein
MPNEKEFFSFPLRLSNEVQRSFDEMIYRPWGCNRQLRTWIPLVDLYETEDAFVLEADLPGVKAEAVHVKIDGNDLVLQGQRVIEHSPSDGRFHTMERYAGEFMRRIGLPESVNEEAIQVQFNDGVLRLVMLKVKEREEA